MSNHIADANKMVDTPRTDARRGFHGWYTAVDAEFSEQLERELKAANDRIKRLEEFVDQLTNPKFTRDDLPKEALLQRIKRLEEAGDALYENSDPTKWDLPEANARKLKEQEAWRKAKEAKL